MAVTGSVSNVSPTYGPAPGLGSQGGVSAQEPQTEAQANAAPIKSPQVVQDPAAGMITEYLDTSTGEVVSQIPSLIAVAYMRQGLSASGMPKEGSEPKVEETA